MTKEIFVESYAGSVFTRKIGKGPPLLIINGGPGFSHQYMVTPLEPLESLRTLIFYDQVGCGYDRTPSSLATAERAERQLLALIEVLVSQGYEKIGMLSHSWGTYLMLRALDHDAIQGMITEAILVSPIPLTWNGLMNTLENFNARLSANDKRKIEEIQKNSQSTMDLEQLKILLPYYVYEPASLKDLIFESYSRASGLTTLESANGFDIAHLITRLPDRKLLVHGRQDFITKADIAELIDAVPYCHIFNKTGHFPFVEAPARFIRALQSFLVD